MIPTEYLLTNHIYRVSQYTNYIKCLNVHGYIGCLNIQGIHVTANNSTTNNVVFFIISDLKIVYNNNY